MTARTSNDGNTIKLETWVYGLFALERVIGDAAIPAAEIAIVFVNPAAMMHVPVLLVPEKNFVGKTTLGAWRDDTGRFGEFRGFLLKDRTVRWPNPGQPVRYGPDQAVTADCSAFSNDSLTLLPDLLSLTGGKPLDVAERKKRASATASLSGGNIAAISAVNPTLRPLWNIPTAKPVVRPVAGALFYGVDVPGPVVKLEIWNLRTNEHETDVVLDASKTGADTLGIVLKNVPPHKDQKIECDLRHLKGLYGLTDGKEAPVPTIAACCDGNNNVVPMTCSEYIKLAEEAQRKGVDKTMKNGTLLYIFNGDGSGSCGGSRYDTKK
jgi:hypothetical protein